MLNVAVIGVGNMGRHHARGYSEMRNVNLVAVCDIDEKIAKSIAKEFSCKYYTDYKEILKEDIQAVSIAVPTTIHKEVALAAIEKGKHVLIEKPISDTIEGAQEIIKKAKENKVKLLVGHIERFNPAIQKLKEIIENKELGTLISIIARRVGLAPPKIKDTNVIIDLAVHDIDIMNYLTEKLPIKVYSGCKESIKDRQEDSAELFLVYDEGIVGFVQVNWVTPIKIRKLNVTGTKGYGELDYITQELTIYENEHSKHPKTFDDVIKLGNLNKAV